MPLASGTKLGPYEVLATIGAGGMGEVYRAHDPRMGRDVAIKISTERFNDRFSREVRAVAALNHPNICQLYDVGPDYLVMELVEGTTLAERIGQGAVPLDESLKIAKQIADALEAAHEKGIVHRDLKPGNIILRPDGMVKVLDFGLAKIVDPAPEGSPESSPTLRFQPATRVGVILGTAAYMPPEQARGKVVDKRADIWAFGVVLYEMLTGARLFEGETVSDTLMEVAIKEPDWSRVPARTERLLRHCLEKDPKQRLRDIGDAWVVLETMPPEAAVQSLPSRPLLGAKLAWGVAAVLSAALAFLAFVHFRQKAPALARPVRFHIPLPENSHPFPFLSPDGRKLAFGAGGRLWVHFLGSGESRDLAPYEGTPFWSADSRFIGFPLQGKLKKMDATGGPPQTVADLPGGWGAGAWNQDDVIVFAVAPSPGLFRVPAAGGIPVQITVVDSARERSNYWPSFLSDGRHFFYTRSSTNPEKSAIYLGSLDAKPEQQSLQPLVASNWGAIYAPSADPGTGYLLFMRDGTLMAQSFDNRRLELKGQPMPIAEQVADNAGGCCFGAFSASANDVLAFRQAATPGAQLTWYGRDGKVLGTIGEPGLLRDPALSRDGKQVAVSRSDSRGVGKTANLWLLDLTRGGASKRLTFDASLDDFPVFSPDGSRIVFSSTRDELGSLYQKLTSGAKEEESVLTSSEEKYPSSWSLDGRFLLYTVRTTKTQGDIWILPMEGSKREPMPFQATESNEFWPKFSPDGHWVAYESDESGHFEVYVREFTLGSDGKPEATGKHQISTGGGMVLQWRDDGKELFYEALDRRTILSAEITSKPIFQSLPGKELFRLPSALSTVPAVTGDGKRFLVAMPISQSGPPQFTVVLNWQTELKK
jgi:serine/threonine protein kinase/Tol biopolymer transport system component